MSGKKRRLETIETLAARFALPRRTIVREVMSSRLPYVSIAGKWRFRERDVQVWLERAGALPRMTLIQGGRSAVDEVDGAPAARSDAQG